jgi:hypothetical protein
MKDIRDTINQIASGINTILNKETKTKYFLSIILLYSFVENLLKWLVATKILWDETCNQVDAELKGEKYPQVDFEEIREKAKKLRFYDSINQAHSLGLIKVRLFNKLHKIREQRNDLIHQLWIYEHRNDVDRMRAMLEDLARTSNRLVAIFNNLMWKEIGVDMPEVFELL